MTRFNWDRPNNGYEIDEWSRVKLGGHKPRKFKPKAKPKPVNLWGCEQHAAEVRLMKYSGRQQPVLWCLECNKHLKSLSQNDYLAYLTLKNQK